MAEADGAGRVTAGPTGAGLGRWVPGVRTFRQYRRGWLASDLVAGLVLTAFLVPVGMGYAQAAGLPPITGLYATIVPLLVYAVFGPSRVMVLGPDSALAAVIAGIILPLGGRDPARAVALAGMLAILTGLMILLAGVARLGFVTELLSRPVQLGYLYGIAITIMVGQLPKLFGFSVDGTGLLPEAWGFVQGLARGETNRAALAVGLAGMVVILGLRRLWSGFPGVIVARRTRHRGRGRVRPRCRGVQVIGVLPQGLPSFAFPDVRLADLPLLFGGALGIALVAVADTTVLSQSLATRRREVVDSSQTASLSARWSAIDFGTSSPRTTLRYVRMRNARTNASSSGIQSSKIRERNDAPIAPRRMLKTVMPTCTVEMKRTGSSSIVSAVLARRFPRLAISSRRGRRAVTSAYSAATKMAFPSTSRRMTRMRRESLTPGRPRRGY